MERGEGVVSLKRGLDILRAFRDTHVPLANKDIAERCKLPKTTVARLTYTLTRMGYLKQPVSSGQYHIGERVTLLGNAVLRGLTIRQVALPLMQSLADQFDMSVALGVAERTRMIYIAYCRSPKTMTMRLRVGSLVPMAQTAMGRAYLWALPPEQRELHLKLIAEEAGDEAPKVLARLQDAFAQIDKSGYSMSLGEWRREIYAVGAPVWVNSDQMVLALNCGARRQGMTAKLFRDTVGPALTGIADKVGDLMVSLGQSFWGE